MSDPVTTDGRGVQGGQAIPVAILNQTLPQLPAGVQTKPAATALTNYENLGAATKANIKNSAGNVFSLRFTNANGAVRYLQLHDKATAPAGGDTPVRSWLLPAGTATQPAALELTSTYFNNSVAFANGIGWAVSTTASTFTDSATAADHTMDLNYA